MHAFDVLADPVRRRILELLADGEHSSGEVGEVIQREFGISQPAVSQHLKVLRDNGFALVRADGACRLYAVEAQPLQEVDRWLDHFRQLWTRQPDAVGTEIARGKRERPHSLSQQNEKDQRAIVRAIALAKAAESEQLAARGQSRRDLSHHTPPETKDKVRWNISISRGCRFSSPGWCWGP